MVRLLVAGGSNIDAADSQGSTALLVAAAAAHVDVVNAMIELRADVDARDSEGMTPLMEASRATDGFDVAVALIEGKASLNLFSKVRATTRRLDSHAPPGLCSV